MSRKIAAHLLADRLTLYADDKALKAAIFPAPESPVVEAMWNAFTRMAGFPRKAAALGGRHVPSVLQWFEEYELTAVDRRIVTLTEPIKWKKPKHRA